MSKLSDPDASFMKLNTPFYTKLEEDILLMEEILHHLGCRKKTYK